VMKKQKRKVDIQDGRGKLGKVRANRQDVVYLPTVGHHWPMQRLRLAADIDLASMGHSVAQHCGLGGGPPNPGSAFAAPGWASPASSTYSQTFFRPLSMFLAHYNMCL
jgi:hypothetical protein